MRRAKLAGMLALAGCALPARGGADLVYTVHGEAIATAAECSFDAARRLGYDVAWYGHEGLRAERELDRTTGQVSRGYLTVAVVRDSAARVLYVRAERYADESDLPVPRTYPPTATPRPTPYPTGRRVGAPRRVAPGPVAADARSLARSCSIGPLREAES